MDIWLVVVVVVVVVLWGNAVVVDAVEPAVFMDQWLALNCVDLLLDRIGNGDREGIAASVAQCFPSVDMDIEIGDQLPSCCFNRQQWNLSMTALILGEGLRAVPDGRDRAQWQFLSHMAPKSKVFLDHRSEMMIASVVSSDLCVCRIDVANGFEQQQSVLGNMLADAVNSDVAFLLSPNSFVSKLESVRHQRKKTYCMSVVVTGFAQICEYCRSAYPLLVTNTCSDDALLQLSPQAQLSQQSACPLDREVEGPWIMSQCKLLAIKVLTRPRYRVGALLTLSALVALGWIMKRRQRQAFRVIRSSHEC